MMYYLANLSKAKPNHFFPKLTFLQNWKTMWEGRIQNIQVVFPKQILGLLYFLRAKKRNMLSCTALQSLLLMLFQILLAMKQLNPNYKTLLITQVFSILILQADLFNGLEVVVIKLTIFQLLTIIKGQNYFPKEKGLHPKQNFLICISLKFFRNAQTEDIHKTKPTQNTY